MEINPHNYLSHDEIKEICQDELRNQVKAFFKTEKEAQRLLSNLAYEMVDQEVSKIVPDYKSELVEQVNKILKDNSSLNYVILNYDFHSGAPRSAAAKIIEQTVKENTELIKQRVIESIKNRDYSEDTWNKF
jgi:hypothetical protein